MNEKQPGDKWFAPLNEGNTMKKALLATLTALTLFSSLSFAGDKLPVVGGEKMYPTKDIIDNAVKSADHTTLVAAVKAAGLVDTLKGKGPFTVFAPTNAAFEKLPAGTVETLLKPENKDTLTKILTYHVVAGKLTAAKLKAEIKKGEGKYEMKTVSGGTLTIKAKDKSLVLEDEKGSTSTITIADVMQKNGVIHVVDSVVQPN